MIKNNIEVDLKVKCLEEGITQAKLGERMGTSAQYVNRVIKKNDGLISHAFVQLMEELGYDIELHYIKRENKEPKEMEL